VKCAAGCGRQVNRVEGDLCLECVALLLGRLEEEEPFPAAGMPTPYEEIAAAISQIRSLAVGGLRGNPGNRDAPGRGTGVSLAPGGNPGARTREGESCLMGAAILSPGCDLNSVRARPPIYLYTCRTVYLSNH
jgi:hypothetical protein